MHSRICRGFNIGIRLCAKSLQFSVQPSLTYPSLSKFSSASNFQNKINLHFNDRRSYSTNDESGTLEKICLSETENSNSASKENILIENKTTPISTKGIDSSISQSPAILKKEDKKTSKLAFRQKSNFKDTPRVKRKKGDKWNLPSVESLVSPDTTFNKISAEPDTGINEKAENTDEDKLIDAQLLNEVILSQVDEKGQEVLERRPEMKDMLIDLIGEDIMKGAKGVKRLSNNKRVPEGWRKDRSLPEWKRQIYALREKFGEESWSPRKKLSREAIEGIRALKEHAPYLNSGDIAKTFKVSPESIRRLLKVKWRPSDEEFGNIAARWVRRGERVKEDLKRERKEQRLLERKEKEKQEALESKFLNIAGLDIKSKKKAKKQKKRPSQTSYDDNHSPPTIKGLGNKIF